jgi:hypothetical protein
VVYFAFAACGGAPARAAPAPAAVRARRALRRGAACTQHATASLWPRCSARLPASTSVSAAGTHPRPSSPGRRARLRPWVPCSGSAPLRAERSRPAEACSLLAAAGPGMPSHLAGSLGTRRPTPQQCRTVSSSGVCAWKAQPRMASNVGLAGEEGLVHAARRDIKRARARCRISVSAYLPAQAVPGSAQNIDRITIPALVLTRLFAAHRAQEGNRPPHRSASACTLGAFQHLSRKCCPETNTQCLRSGSTPPSPHSPPS